MALPTGNELLPFALKKGNKKVQMSSVASSALWGGLRHDEMVDTYPVVNFTTPWQVSAKFIVDGGARATGGSNNLLQGVVTQKIIDAPLKLNLGALRTLRGKNAADYLKLQMEGAGETIGQLIESATVSVGGLITSSTTILVTPTAAVPGQFFCSNINGLFAGMSITVLNAAKTGCATFRLSDVIPNTASASLGGTLSVVQDVPGVTVLADPQLAALFPAGAAVCDVYQRGAVQSTVALVSTVVESLPVTGGAVLGANVLGLTSLINVADPSTASLYGTTLAQRAAQGATGQKFASFGDPSQEAFILRAQRVRGKSGKLPNSIVCGLVTGSILKMGAITEGRVGPLGSIAVGNSRRDVGMKNSKYSSSVLDDAGSEVAGRDLIPCAALDDSKAFFIHTDHAYYAVWHDVQADQWAGQEQVPDIGSYTTNILYSTILEFVGDHPAVFAFAEGIEVGV